MEIWSSSVFAHVPATVDPTAVDPTVPRMTFLLLHNVPGVRGQGSVKLSSGDPAASVVWDTALFNDSRQAKAIA